MHTPRAPAVGDHGFSVAWRRAGAAREPPIPGPRAAWGADHVSLVVFARAPLRITLGGGGTDIPAYYRRHGGLTIGAAIDKHISMLAHTTPFAERYRVKHERLEEVADPADIGHPIVRAALQQHWDQGPIELASVGDVPPGTGLGSSSAYTVCLLEALALAAGRSTSPDRMAEDACAIEIDTLGRAVGKQDGYVAAFGGIRAYAYLPDGSVEVESLELDDATLARFRERSLLFFTGSVRNASDVLADQVARTERGDPEVLDNLHQTRRIAEDTRSALVAGDLDGYGRLLDEHWRRKRARVPGIASERVDRLYDVASDAGALGGRLIGAGGAGFLLVYSRDPDATRTAMAAADAPELEFDIELEGANGTVWR